MYGTLRGQLRTVFSHPSQIAYNAFPMPKIPIPDFVPSSQDGELHPEKRRHTTKDGPSDENLAPEEAALDISERDIQSDEAVLPTNEQYSGNKRRRSSKSPPSDTIEPPADTLPPPLLSLLQTIQSTLSRSFQSAPPHTAQRLAELLLHPTTHYRTLPSYLRALDRIVSVASPASVFPLPDLTSGNTSSGRLPNGTSDASPDPTADKDFIGGAELTEIPWLKQTDTSPGTSIPVNNGPTSDLRTESTSLIDGPNGAGSVETVTVNVNGVSRPASREESGHGITQGELLRQEQEAGIVPVPSSPTNGRITRSGAAATAAAARAVGLEPEEPTVIVEEDSETVHARGPGVIGMEDMGPQSPSTGLVGGLDLEGPLGRRGEGEILASSVEKNDDEEQKKEEEDKDGYGDVVVADADGTVNAEERANLDQQNRGADATDATTL